VETPPRDRELSAEAQRILDAEHLRLLAFFHYVSGGVTLAFALFFAVGLVLMGAMFALVPPPPHGPGLHGAPVALLFLFGFICVIGVLYGILELLAGRMIGRRRRRVFTLVVAIPRLVLIPYGTILSIFTLLVLERASVKELYREASAR